MSKLDVPFNIDLLVLDDKACATMRPVTSLDTFVGSTKNFNPDGLFSSEIFGVEGTDHRFRRFSYIDMKIPIIHPTIFKALGQIKSLYLDVLARREFAVWDPNLQDLVRSNMADGQTGFEFFCEYLPRIKFPTNDSESRDIAVGLLDKYRSQALISRLLVIPAGYREFEFSDDGRESSSEINDYYYRIIAVANTINRTTIETSPQAYDMQRTSMQNAVMELYDLLSKMVEGKNNLMLGKMAGRKVFNGTRNVITSMKLDITDLDDPNNVTMNDTHMGLFQYSKAVLPVAIHHVRNGWIAQCFTISGAPVVLTDPETMQANDYVLKAETYNQWLSAEGIEKLISYYREETIRHNPIMIEGKYLGLVYRGPDGTFAFIHGIEELPSDRDPNHCTPITYTELLYYAMYVDSRRYKAFVTRYPITGIGSIYPSNVYLKTTANSEKRRELDTETWTVKGGIYVAYEFPILGAPFFNSMSPHPVHLARMGADFDGDTGSGTVVYSEDSIKEVDEFFGLRRAYIGSDGRFINGVDYDTVNYVLANITGQ